MAKEKSKKTTPRKKIKVDKIKTEEQEQIERFIKILLIILIAITGIYLFTKFIVTKEDYKYKANVTEGVIDYNKLIVGNILNQNYDEYYVFVYNGNENKAIYYSSLIDKYMAEENAKKVYWVDLSNKLNEKFITKNKEEVNFDAKNISEIKFGEYTLLKISNKQITKYINNIDDAKKELEIND